MKLYVSGSMSAYGEAGNWGFDNFFEAERKLIRAGYDVENPAQKGIVETWKWEDYLRYDLKQMLDCDGVALLPDWGMSRGAMLEKYVAEKLHMPVRSVEQWMATAALSANV